MANEQCSIFDFADDEYIYKINKPIRLIEFFAGVGAQHKALTNLKANFESYKICEWALSSIIGYNAIHLGNFNGIWDNETDKNKIAQFLYEKGVSLNYNEPAPLKNIARIEIDRLKQCANSIINTHNLVNICNVKGKDLDIVDKDKYCYLMTYSYPCQDLSLAGKLKGQVEGSGTRSSLLWEIGRILQELKLTDSLPQVLLMENVPNCHGTKNIKEWHKWTKTLEQLGYKNFWKDLNSKDYEVPQTRNRCYMVSILDCGDKVYNFPKKKKLKLFFKDLLESNVDEKYYLKVNKDIAGTITTRVSESNCTFVACNDGVVIPENTKKGYAIANEGDGVYINRPEQKRGTVQKGIIQTLKTSVDDIGVIVKGYYMPSKHNASRIVSVEGVAPIVMENHGTITAIETSNLRIRKSTPLECFRLMTFSDEDYYKMKQYLSDSKLYHCMGDSIVVKVLEYIFGALICQTSN